VQPTPPCAERGATRSRTVDLVAGGGWTWPTGVLLVATYWCTNLTMRQLGPLFGMSRSTAHRVIDTLGPLPAVAPVRRRRVDQIAIVEDALVLTVITGWQPQRPHRVA
jgi:hypothetical protein